MKSLRDKLKQRFGKAPDVVAAAPTKTPTRRRDYKGERQRLNLRIGADLARDLEILRVATGIDKNVWCEEVLAMAVEERMAAEKARHGAGAWEVIVRCAGGQGDKPVAGEQPRGAGDRP